MTSIWKNVNNYKGYFNVNGRTDYYSLNDSNSYFRTETTIEQISQVDGRTDSVRLKITITPTSSYGKISYLQIHYLYPNLFDVGTMAAGSEESKCRVEAGKCKTLRTRQ